MHEIVLLPSILRFHIAEMMSLFLSSKYTWHVCDPHRSCLVISTLTGVTSRMNPSSIVLVSLSNGFTKGVLQRGHPCAASMRVLFHLFIHFLWQVCPQQGNLGRFQLSSRQILHVDITFKTERNQVNNLIWCSLNRVVNARTYAIAFSSETMSMICYSQSCAIVFFLM